MVCSLGLDDIPYFNAGIYLENKSKIGKIEDIFGTTTEVVRAGSGWGSAAATARLPSVPCP